MKVAIFHDYLNQYGGAERVLEEILAMFPEADLYTLLYDKERTLGKFEGRVTGTSFLDTDAVRRRHRAFIPLMPLAARQMNVKHDYDLVVSSSAGYAKGFGAPRLATSRGEASPFHVSYCHSPLRYAWEVDYLKNLPSAPHALTRTVGSAVARRLRAWDRRAADGVNVFMANSHFIADKIRSYYERGADVVHPPVDPAFYPERTAEGNYILMAGRLLYYKLFGLGIAACRKLGVPLKIVGRGPEESSLRRTAAGAPVEFLGKVTDDELRSLYSNAKALVFPQIEDFGLVAAEAQSCGTPVVAYREGGAADIVTDGTTGVLFSYQNAEALGDAVRTALNTRFDRRRIADAAKRFSKEKFKKKFMDVLKRSGFPL